MRSAAKFCAGVGAKCLLHAITPGCRARRAGVPDLPRKAKTQDAPAGKGPMWLLCQIGLQVGKSVYYLVPVVGHPTSQQAAFPSRTFLISAIHHQIWVYAWVGKYIPR